MSYLNKLKTRIVSIEKHKIPKPAYQVTQTFIEPIYKFDLSSEINSDTIVNHVYNFKEKYPTSNSSNVHAWHSHYKTHYKTNDFDTLILSIKNKLKLIEADLNHDFNIDFFLLDSWVAIYNKTDYSNMHHHYPARWAAIYYAKAEEDCSPIVFTGIEIKPKTSMLLLFPGRTRHMVRKSSSNRERIIFSANFDITIF
jgi:hypothetical protein